MTTKEEIKRLNNYINRRLHIPNSKSWLKYYIGKDLYELFSYAVVIERNFEIEFFTLDENYKKIWMILRTGDYGHCALTDMGYDHNYHCYTVSVVCLELLYYLKVVHDYSNVMGERIWKDKAKNCGWNEKEITEGYFEYKEHCNRWFELHYGKHYPIRNMDILL